MVTRVNEFLGVAAIDDLLENQDISQNNDPEILANYV